MTCSPNVDDRRPEPQQVAGCIVYSPREAAEVLGVTRAHIYNLVERGTLRAYKVGRLTKLRRADVLGLVGGEG